MSTFPMPSIKAAKRGRKPIGITVVDLQGRIYVLNSVRRFAETLGIPRESFYALSRGKIGTLYGLTMYEGDLAGLTEGVDFFVVDEE